MVLIAMFCFAGGAWAQQALPYEYGFEDNDLSADGWTLVDCTGNTGINSGAKLNGNYGFKFYYNTTPPQYLISPELTGTGNGVRVSFYYRNPASYTETFKVGYSTTTNDTNAFDWDEEITATSTWEEYVHTFPAGTKYVAVAYTANDQFNMYMDDFAFMDPTTVVDKPKGLTVNYEGGLEATVSWSCDESLFDIDVNGTVTENITDKTYTLTGLEYGTTYTIKVRAKKGEAVSGWSNAVSFTTEFLAFSLPYAESFENGIGGWTMVDCVSGTGVGSNAYEGSKGFTFRYSTNPPQFLISPEFEAAATTMNVSFWYSVYRSNYPETFQVGYSTTTKDVDAFTWETEVTATNDGEWLQYDTQFPAGTKYVAIRYNSYDMYYLFLDDFSFEVGSAFAKPKDLAVDYQGDLTATVTWTAAEGAISYDIDVNGTVTEGVSSPYELTDLLLSGIYEVKVRANYGEGNYSEWTNAVTFKTNDCMNEEMCYITYELSVTSGYEQYGWFGAKLLVVDADINEVIDSWTVGQNVGTATGALAVCPGANLSFQWYSGGYDSDLVDKVIVKDANGDDIINQTGALTSEISYTVDCTISEFKTPVNVAASEIGPRSAVLSWKEKGESTSWVIELTDNDEEETKEVEVSENPYTLTGLSPLTEYFVRVRPAGENDKWSEGIFFKTTIAAPAPTDLSFNLYPTEAEASWNGFAESYDVQYAHLPAEGYGEGWLQYDDNTHYTNIGSSTAGNRTWGVKYPGSMATGNKLTKVSFYENSNYTTETTVHINIYSGGDNAPGSLVHTEDVLGLGAQGFHEVTFESPVAVTAGNPLWITLTVNGTYVTAACQVNNYDNQWWGTSGTWSNMGEDNANLAGFGWMIRGYFESDASDITWNTATTTEKSYDITGLDPETTYIVQVRGDFGSDGVSEWATSAFTTLASNATPIDLTADVTTTSATLSWTAYQDSYNVQYRTAAQITDTFFFDDFENGLDQWTITAGAEATHPSGGIWYTINPVSGLSFESHSGTYCASSWSWNSSAYHADNWLITPQVTFGNTLKFWVRTSTGYPDSYEVLLSTGGNTTEDFTVTLQAMAPAPENNQWNEVSIDLSAYAGQQGYIAIHHVDYDMNYLVIDDFGIYNVLKAGEWMSASASEATLTLTGLTPGTEYEWQVQGNLTEGTTEWSEIASFTTIADIELADDVDNSTILAANDGKVADVKLVGRSLVTGMWNTFAVPFAISSADLTQLGITAKKLASSTLTSGTLTLNFENADEIEAGKPYLVKVDDNLNLGGVIFDGVTVSNAVVTTETTYADFIPTLGKTTIDGVSAEDVLFLATGNTLKNPDKMPTDMKGFRAYFQLKDANAARHQTSGLL